MPSNIAHELLNTLRRDILNKCLAEGMEMPFVICLMNPNGALQAMRVWRDGEKISGEHLARHDVPEGFTEPITVIVLDQNNKYKCYLIIDDEDGATMMDMDKLKGNN